MNLFKNKTETIEQYLENHLQEICDEISAVYDKRNSYTHHWIVDESFHISRIEWKWFNKATVYASAIDEFTCYGYDEDIPVVFRFDVVIKIGGRVAYSLKKKKDGTTDEEYLVFERK